MLKTIWDISNEDFIKYVNESNKYTELLKKCGYTNLGNSKTVKKRIALLNLSVNHFTKNTMPQTKKIPSSEIFIENSTYNNNTNIKKKLCNEFNWEYKCLHCGISEWQGEKISLELDHISGNNTDNRIEKYYLFLGLPTLLRSAFKYNSNFSFFLSKCNEFS